MNRVVTAIVFCTVAFMGCAKNDSAIFENSTRIVLFSSETVAEPNVENREESVAEPNVENRVESVAELQEGTMTDSRDGQVYKTVKIGEQVWMAQNLNYAYYGREAKKDSSSFCYNDSAEYCAKYGRLYTWAAAMDSSQVFSDAGSFCGNGNLCYVRGMVRGVCPEGWHLPSVKEWERLIAQVGDFVLAGLTLKSRSGWIPHLSVSAGTNAYAFSVLPAGVRDYENGRFINVGYAAIFWSSSESGNSKAYDVRLRYNFDSISQYAFDKNYAYSVRCLKDSN